MERERNGISQLNKEMEARKRLDEDESMYKLHPNSVRDESQLMTRLFDILSLGGRIIGALLHIIWEPSRGYIMLHRELPEET
jgi:hypothetical protein